MYVILDNLFTSLYPSSFIYKMEKIRASITLEYYKTWVIPQEIHSKPRTYWISLVIINFPTIILNTQDKYFHFIEKEIDFTVTSLTKIRVLILWWCWKYNINLQTPNSNTNAKSWLIGKDPDAGRDWGQEKKGMTEDEMSGWHHQLNGHEFE